MSRLIKLFFLILALVSFQARAQEGNPLKVFNFSRPTAQYNNYQENDAGQERHQIEFEGKARTYQTYVPATETQEPRPAILLLHGARRTGVSLVEKWKDIADQNNIILIGPSTLGWAWNGEVDSPQFIDAVLEDASKKYRIDPKRIYIFGHSSGGSYAIYLSILRSTKFAATALHAGMIADPMQYHYVNNAERKIPIAFFIGTDDKIFPLSKVRATAEVFSAAGHDTSMYIYKDHTHWYYDAAPQINQQAWEFLSRHTLP